MVVLPNGYERSGDAVRGLLRELAELRALDLRRHAHPPGSSASDRATAELDARTILVMDHFRDAHLGNERGDGD